MKRDSNPRPSGPKPDALPSCAIHRLMFYPDSTSRWEAMLPYSIQKGKNGVANETWTRDNRNHNPGLYQLSYSHHWVLPTFPPGYGTPERIRTFDLWLRRPTLYPTELRAHAPSAERNNTDITLCRLVLFLLFFSFGLFFDSYLPLKWIFDVIHALSWITCCLLQQVIGI